MKVKRTKNREQRTENCFKKKKSGAENEDRTRNHWQLATDHWQLTTGN
jgi:hypothetical protein